MSFFSVNRTWETSHFQHIKIFTTISFFDDILIMFNFTFLFTVDIQTYFILVSVVQHSKKSCNLQSGCMSLNFDWRSLRLGHLSGITKNYVVPAENHKVSVGFTQQH